MSLSPITRTEQTGAEMVTDKDSNTEDTGDF